MIWSFGLRTSNLFRVLLALSFGLAVCAPAHATPSVEWHRGPDMPSARDYLGCGIADGLFVVAGGAYWEHEAKHFGQQTIAYSPTQNRWIRFPDLPMPGAYGASAVIDDRLLIAGGADSTGALKRCFRLRRVEGRLTWDRLPDLPRPIWGASGAAVGSRFYVVGGAQGMDAGSMKAARPSLLMLDVSAVKPEWLQMVGPGMPSGRVGAAAVVVGTKLFVFGGYGVQADGTLGNFGDAYVRDIGVSSGTWQPTRNVPLASRWTSAVPLDSRQIVLVGGYAESPVAGFLDDTLIYDTDSDRYLQTDPIPCAVATTAAAGDGAATIYVAGGEDAMRHRSAALLVGSLVDR